MDFYSIFKFLHVVTSTAWLGAGSVLLFLGILAARANNDAEVRQIARLSGVLALRWFVPSSLLTAVFGAVATTLGGLWGEAWVTLALVGFIATFSIGNFVLRPAADRVATLGATGQDALAMAETRRILDVNKFDCTMLFVVVADMVLKPDCSDLGLLAVMAVVLIAAGIVFLLPGLRGKSAAAA